MGVIDNHRRGTSLRWIQKGWPICEVFAFALRWRRGYMV